MTKEQLRTMHNELTSKGYSRLLAVMAGIDSRIEYINYNVNPIKSAWIQNNKIIYK